MLCLYFCSFVASCKIISIEYFFNPKVIDIENGKKLGPGKEGELWIKSPLQMKGYMGDDAASEILFDDEGYIRTGDIGYYDKDGYFYIVDRLKELIKYKGFQVIDNAFITLS